MTDFERYANLSEKRDYNCMLVLQKTSKFEKHNSINITLDIVLLLFVLLLFFNRTGSMDEFQYLKKNQYGKS